MTQEVGTIAQKGLEFLWNATVASASGISNAINKAQKQYANYHEKEQLENLRKLAKPAPEILFSVMQRFCYLFLAGYNNEAAACARKAAIKLADSEKSSVPLDAVLVIGRVLTSVTSNYGDFSKSSWLNLSDFLNSSRMGKDHYDRDALVNDLYFSLLILLENSGGVNERFERGLMEAAGRLIEGSNYQGEISHSPYAASAYNVDSLGGALPSYAQVPSALPSYAQVPSASTKSSRSSLAMPFSSGSSKSNPSAIGKTDDAKTRAAKVLYMVSSSIKKAAEEAETRRQKSLRDAADILKRERDVTFQSGSGLGSGPSSVPATRLNSGSTYGSSSNTTAGYGSGSGYGMGSSKGTGYGSNTGW